MAGVTGNCKECGFAIFDEQTRTGLCDACLALPPSERLSAVRAREAELDKIDKQIFPSGRDRSSLYTRLTRTRVQPRPVNGLLDDLERLQREIKELEKIKERMEAEAKAKADAEKEVQKSEAPSFLRKFDNLDVESEL